MEAILEVSFLFCRLSATLFILNADSGIIKVQYNQKRKMNFSMPNSSVDFNIGNQYYSNCPFYPEYESLNLLKLLSLALSVSVSAYSNFRCQESSPILEQNDDSSVIQIEKPVENSEHGQSLVLPQELFVSQLLKKLEQNKEESVGKADTEKFSKQLSSHEPISPLPVCCQEFSKRIENSVEIEEKPQDWQPPTKCPKLGISSCQIQQKRNSLLQRHIHDWNSGNKGAKRSRGCQLKSRQIRMLFN